MNMPSRINPRNLGFYISPDITIECVTPEVESSNFEFPVLPQEEPASDDDNDVDPYFNPLTFCAVKMDDDDDLQQNDRLDSKVKIDCSVKASKKVKLDAETKVMLGAETNENSSFVCNGSSIPPAVKPKKRYACNLCPKTFGWSTDLKRHHLIHTGERPFKCTMCNATFTRNFLLQKHKNKMHLCQSPSEVSQLNNNVAKNLMEIKKKMLELLNSKTEVKIADHVGAPNQTTC